MRIMVIAVLMLLVAGTLTAAEKKFGKALTVKTATKVSEILANPDNYNGKRVLVEGTVVEVCKKRGCWIKIGSDKEFESIQFKVEDGVIVFPMMIKGKTARAEGVVDVKKYSVEQLIEQGEEHAKEQGTKFDPASVKGPKTVVRLMGEGAVVR